MRRLLAHPEPPAWPLHVQGWSMRMAGSPCTARLLLSLSVLLALASQHAAAAGGGRAGGRRALLQAPGQPGRPRALLQEQQLPLDDSYLDRALIADSDGVDLLRVSMRQRGRGLASQQRHLPHTQQSRAMAGSSEGGNSLPQSPVCLQWTLLAEKIRNGRANISVGTWGGR